MLGAIFSLAVNNLSVDPQIFPPLLLLCVCGIPLLPFAWSCLPGSLAWLSPLAYILRRRHASHKCVRPCVSPPAADRQQFY